jgi:hypothetical protein
VFASLHERCADKIIARARHAERCFASALRFLAKLGSPHATGTSAHLFDFFATRLCNASRTTPASDAIASRKRRRDVHRCKFFSQDALALGRERRACEQMRAYQCLVIRSDRSVELRKNVRRSSEAERGDIAERDERGDARDHIRLGEKWRVTLVRHLENVDVEAALAHRIERRG